MHRLRFLILLALPVLAPLCALRAQNAPAPKTENVASATTLTQAQALEDFDFLRQALEEADSGLYRHVAKPELERMFAAQRASFHHPVTKLELARTVAGTLAAIGCGHTGFQPDEELRALATTAPMFPLRVFSEGNRLLVLFNDTAVDQSIRPGMEILEINGRPTSEVLATILAHVSGDGRIETGKRVGLGRTFPLSYWLSVEQPAEFAITARDGAGEIVKAKLPGVREPERAKNQNPVNTAAMAGTAKVEGSRDNVTFRFVQEPGVAYLRVRGFSGREFPPSMENSFRTLQEKGAKVLVLDLRRNGGGNDLFGAMLVSYLTDKPFRYFERIEVKTTHPSFAAQSDWRAEREEALRAGVTPNPAGGFLATAKLHPGVAEQPPGKHPFAGKVFVLIDGGTFSTAADVCAVLRSWKRATFIGEETGGAYRGNNSGMMVMVTLPASKLRVRIPMYGYWNAVTESSEPSRGIQPDHPAEMKMADLLQGIDGQLELALKLATQALGTGTQ